MKSQKYNSLSALVYSTNPDAVKQPPEEEIKPLPPEEQNLNVVLDTKKRRGKTITLITGFIGSETALKSLEKNLKTLCGTGGSSKGGDVLIQGDFKQKVTDWLKAKGYRVK